MLFINDIVRVTEEAKRDTYEDAWWTEKDLKIVHIDKDFPDGVLYSFETVDGEEVPNSLFEHELSLVKSYIDISTKERLEYRYSMCEYSVDGNIDEDAEVEFLENIVDDFSSTGLLETAITESMIPFYEDSFENKLNNAQYIEDYINEFIQSCGVNNFRQALDGGIREYLYAQFFSNSGAVYKNIIYRMLNDKLDDIDMLNIDSEIQDNLFLQVNTFTVESIVEDFVSEELDINCIYDKSSFYLYREFCEFLSNKVIEE